MTEEYGLIDDYGDHLVLVAIPIGSGSYSFEVHTNDLQTIDGEPVTKVPWVLYASPVSFLELCYIYYDGGLGTLRYPKLVGTGKPVRIVTTTDMAGPTYKKVEYLRLELPPLLHNKPRLLTDGYTCGSTHVVGLQPGINVAGGCYYDGILYQCNRISPDSAYLSIVDSLSRAIEIT